jgi:septal ring factor EnvC (AmiA/AmiB activator)
MQRRVLAVALSTAVAFAAQAPAVLAMDADSLKGDSSTSRSCDTINRNIKRTNKKLDDAEYELAELQVKAETSTSAHLRADIAEQKGKVRRLEEELKRWQREWAKHCD